MKIETSKTIFNLIEREIQAALVAVIIFLIAVFSSYEIHSFLKRSEQVENLIFNQIESVATNKTLSQDYISIQQELSRFVTTLKSTLPYDVHINVRLADQLLAGAGELKASIVPSTNIVRSVHLPSGKTLTIEAQVSNAKVVVEALLLLGIFIAAAFGLYKFLSSRLEKSVARVSQPLLDTIEWVKVISSNLPESLDTPKMNTTEDVAEISSLNSAVGKLVREIHTLEDKVVKLNFDKARAEVADQVAHDIRSPLSSLDMAIKNLEKVEASEKLSLQKSLFRIRDVLNDLPKKNQTSIENEKASLSSLKNDDSVLIAPIVSDIIGEKRSQYQNRHEIIISFETLENGLSSFSKVNGKELFRVISNLIDNAIEAIAGVGSVNISVGQDSENIKISISDNGKGIPSQVLEKLGQRGNTFGKTNGSGLGLFHAIETISSFGGKLEVVSKIGQGTTVSISLPKSEILSNFFDKISTDSTSKFVIVEDDPTIHETYKLLSKNIPIKLEFHDSPESLMNKNSLDEDAFFLIDFDFENSELNGINLIQKLNLQNRSVLVSGRWNDPEVALSCEYLGVKRFPKEMLGLLPILNQKHVEIDPHAALITNR